MNQNLPGPDREQVRALVQIEHDGISRVPGTDSECFLVDGAVAESLGKLGVLARGSDVVRPPPDEALATLDDAVLISNSVPALFDPESTLLVLHDAQMARTEIASALADSQESLAELRELVAARDAELAELRDGQAGAAHAELTAALEAARTTLAERDAELQTLRDAATDRDAELVQLREQLTLLQSGQADVAARGSDGAKPDATAKKPAAKKASAK